MPDHKWNGLPLLLCERHKLRREFADHVAVERHVACCPGAIQDGEQQQWIFGSVSKRFGALDELTGMFNRCFRLRRSITLEVHESVNECDLQLDLLTTQERRAGQGCKLVKGPPELLSSLDQGRPRQRPLPRFAPKACGFLDQAGLGPMPRQQFRSVLSDFREFALDGFGDAGMEGLSRLAQQRSISSVPHKGVLEQISRMRGQVTPKQQTGCNETVQRRCQLRLRLAR